MAQEAIRFARTGSTRTSRHHFLLPAGRRLPGLPENGERLPEAFPGCADLGSFPDRGRDHRGARRDRAREEEQPAAGIRAAREALSTTGRVLRGRGGREAREETGLELVDLAQFHTYSDPARDPRFHTVTTVFSARAEGVPRAGDDAADVRVVRPAGAGRAPVRIRPRQVLQDWIAQARPAAAAQPPKPSEGKGRRRRGSAGLMPSRVREKSYRTGSRGLIRANPRVISSAVFKSACFLSVSRS